LKGIIILAESIVLVIKAKEVGEPKVIEAGQILKELLILAARNLKTKGVPIAIWLA
jgi:hypothetical protein